MSDTSKRAKILRPQLDPSCVWARGPFALDKIVVKVLDGTRAYSEEITKAANDHWEGTVIKEKPNLFDGPIWSLVQHEVQIANRSGQEAELDGKTLHLSVQLSSYKFNLFTHFVGRNIVPLPSRCNGLGVMSLTETADGYFVFGLRSRKAGAMPWHWHCVPAGVLDAPDPRAVLDKELNEETGYDWTTVRRGDVLALISAGEEQGHKPELLCRMSLSASAADVHDRHKAAEDRAEHEALIFVKVPCQRSGSDAFSGTANKPEGSTDMEAIIVEAGTSPLFANIEDFLCGGRGPITDLARTALLLVQDTASPEVLPLPETYDSL